MNANIIGVRNHDDDVAYFLAFCIEMYRHDLNITGKEATAILTKAGALDYLAEHFEAIHTQSHQGILEDIKQFVKTHSA